MDSKPSVWVSMDRVQFLLQECVEDYYHVPWTRGSILVALPRPAMGKVSRCGRRSMGQRKEGGDV